MPEKSEIFVEILDENKKPIIEDALNNVYAKEVQQVISWGKGALETVSHIFSKDKGNKEEDKVNLPERQTGLPLSYAESAMPESQNDGTLETVTRQELPEATGSSSIFKNVSYGFRGFSARATYRNSENESYSLFAGEKVGVGYEKKEGFLNRYTKGVKAEYNAFSGRATIGAYYNTPQDSVGASVFYKNGNYGITADYSNDSGLSAKAAWDKKGAALNVDYKHTFKGCNVVIGAFASTEYKTAGIHGRVTF